MVSLNNLFIKRLPFCGFLHAWRLPHVRNDGFQLLHRKLFENLNFQFLITLNVETFRIYCGINSDFVDVRLIKITLRKYNSDSNIEPIKLNLMLQKILLHHRRYIQLP